jgi:hypothetical protein
MQGHLFQAVMITLLICLMNYEINCCWIACARYTYMYLCLKISAIWNMTPYNLVGKQWCLEEPTASILNVERVNVEYYVKIILRSLMHSVFVFHDSTAFFFSQIFLFKPPCISSIVPFEIFYELWDDFSSVDRQHGVQILGKPALSVCEHANNPEFNFHEDRKHRCSSLQLCYHQELEAARVTL